MSGLYIHIPFCRKACHYCNFHFSTNLSNKRELAENIAKEISLRKDFLNGENLETIYFGGGTPSLLAADELQIIFDSIEKNFNINLAAEITIETNPDDLTNEKIKSLRQTPVNRFSIGTQSFFDKDLLWMNRAHNAAEATSSIKRAQDAGFENISIDLIYGLPESTHLEWQTNLQTAFDLQVPHLSSYCLTVEPKTALAKNISSGKTKPVDEEKSAEQFELLMKEAKKNNFVHYEISNFGKENFFSKHNGNYWNGKKYLGVGPSAHSFKGEIRQWNVANNFHYNEALAKNMIPNETEILTPVQRLNEYVMTSLRTIWGCNLDKIKSDFDSSLSEIFLHKLSKMKDSEHISIDKNIFSLTEKGKMIADKIILDLWLEEPNEKRNR